MSWWWELRCCVRDSSTVTFVENLRTDCCTARIIRRWGHAGSMEMLNDVMHKQSTTSTWKWKWGWNSDKGIIRRPRLNAITLIRQSQIHKQHQTPTFPQPCLLSTSNSITKTNHGRQTESGSRCSWWSRYRLERYKQESFTDFIQARKPDGGVPSLLEQAPWLSEAERYRYHSWRKETRGSRTTARERT